MATLLTKPVTRETGATVDGRPLIVTLLPDYTIALKPKGLGLKAQKTRTLLEVWGSEQRGAAASSGARIGGSDKKLPGYVSAPRLTAKIMISGSLDPVQKQHCLNCIKDLVEEK